MPGEGAGGGLTRLAAGDQGDPGGPSALVIRGYLGRGPAARIPIASMDLHLLGARTRASRTGPSTYELTAVPGRDPTNALV